MSQISLNNIFTIPQLNKIEYYKKNGHSKDFDTTDEIGKWGELFVAKYFESLGYKIEEMYTTIIGYDIVVSKNSSKDTIEVKTELQPYLYGNGGFLVEIGNTLEGKYAGQTNRFSYKGTYYASTGLKATKAKYFVLTDLEDIYVIETKVLKDFYMNYGKNKCKLGGYKNRMLGFQITFDEAKQIAWKCYKCKTESISFMDLLNNI